MITIKKWLKLLSWSKQIKKNAVIFLNHQKLPWCINTLKCIIIYFFHITVIRICKKTKKTWCPKWFLNIVKRPKHVLDQFREIHPTTEGPALHNNASMNSWSSGSCSVMYSNKLLSVLCLSGLQFVPNTVLLSKKSEAPRLDTHLPALLAPSTILWLQCHKQAPWQHAYTYSSKYQVSIYDASPESDESMPSHISSQNQKKKYKIYIILYQKSKTRFLAL